MLFFVVMWFKRKDFDMKTMIIQTIIGGSLALVGYCRCMTSTMIRYRICKHCEIYFGIESFKGGSIPPYPTKSIFYSIYYYAMSF